MFKTCSYNWPRDSPVLESGNFRFCRDDDNFGVSVIVNRSENLLEFILSADVKFQTDKNKPCTHFVIVICQWPFTMLNS